MGRFAESDPEPRVLLYDLERLPGRLPERDIWEPRDMRYVNYIHPDRWIAKPRIVCGSWMFYGERGAHFVAAWHHPDADRHVAAVFAELFAQADVTVGFNSRQADAKWLRQQWAKDGIDAPPKRPDIDLYVVARQAFALEAKSLDYLCRYLGIPSKQGRYNAEEARAALAGDEAMRRKLERYSRADSRIMAPVLDRCRPYLPGPTARLMARVPIR